MESQDNKDQENSLENETSDEDSLESTPVTESSPEPETAPTEPDKPSQPEKSQKPDKKQPFKKLGALNPLKGVVPIFKRVDVYLLIFVLVLIVAIFVVILTVQNGNKQNTGGTNSQNLNQSALSQLNNNDITVGGSSQTLDIQSNTVISGNVLTKGNLEVAGALKVGGSLNLPGITVSGTTSLDQVNASSLSIAGSATIKGDLSVSGSATFGGNVSASELSVSNLQLNGDIQIQHHITTSGSIPGVSNSGSLGSGGTASIGGTDTAGTVDIKTGSSPSSGCLVHVSFAQSFSNIPHVVIGPVGSSSTWSGLGYYVDNLSTSGFSICANSPQSGQAYDFSYIAIS